MIKEVNIAREVDKLRGDIIAVLRNDARRRGDILQAEAFRRPGQVRDKLYSKENIILIGYVLYKAKQEGVKTVAEVMRFADVRIVEAVENAQLSADLW